MVQSSSENTKDLFQHSGNFEQSLNEWSQAEEYLYKKIKRKQYMEIQNEHFPEMLNGGLHKSCFNRPSKSCQLKAETEGLITVVLAA